LAQAPIARIEAQGYVYAALTRLQAPLERIGEAELAADFRSHADALRNLVNGTFWWNDARTYALALDGNGRQVQSLASNAGHALWCGVADEEKAIDVANTLMSDELFGGWGIRTLGKSHPRF